MCGIFGIIGNYDIKKVRFSLDKMSSRGPDAQKISQFNGGVFAQNRLAIVAPTNNFDPPFSKNGAHFVFNGEFYNFKDFDKNAVSDSLSAFELFHKNKTDFLSNHEGMFAIAHFDEQSKILTLARDRFGKKPLYYTQYNNTFIFASSIDAILPHVKTDLNKVALKSYLSYRSVIGQESIYENIYKLPASHYLTFDGKNIAIRKYFNFFEQTHSAQDIQELILDAVSKRVIDNGKLAAFLSGGIDSSTVCALASRLTDKKLHTFCIGYDGYEKDDERHFANLSAKAIGSVHTEIVFSKNDFLDSLQQCIAAFDEPIADNTAVALNFMCKYVSSQGIKAVLSGEGGDEAFLGYPKYEQFMHIQSAAKLPFAPYLGGFFKRHEEQNREWDWYKRALSDEILYRSAAEIFTDRQKINLLNQKVSINNGEKLIQDYYGDYNLSSQSYDVWMSYIDIYVWLGEVLLQKADKISMANSLEIRTPFMDSKLLVKALSLGDKRFPRKSILKNIAKNLLPSEVINREKKGFSYPFNKWLFDVGDPDIVFKVNAKTQLFHKKYLTFLFNNAQKGSFKHQFWSVYMFCKWYESRNL